MSKFRLQVATALGASAVLLGACSNEPAATTTPTAATGTATSTPAATAAKLGLDAMFGTNGIANVPLTTSAHDRFMAVAVAPDGKTYAAGFTTVGTGDQAMAVARLDAKGALDKTFGKDGIATANVAIGGKAVEVARSIVIQSSGKIVVAGPIEHDVAATGDAAKDTDVALVRFESNGTLDAGFGKAGVVILDLGAGKIVGAAMVGDNAWGLGTLPGDRLVMFGTTLATGAGRTDADFALVGFTATGALDTAFGTGGKVIVDQGSSIDNPRNVLVQADGRIVATGYSNISGVVQPVLIRTNAAGVLDKEFGRDGLATARVLGAVAESYNVAQQGSDYITAGYGTDTTGGKVDMIVNRWKGNGTLDTAFGNKGTASLDIAKEDDRVRNVTVLADGRILAIGSGKKTATNIDAMIAVFTRDGQLDRSFGTEGNIISDLGGPADAWYGVAFTPDKKFAIIAGYKGTDATSGGNDDAVVARITLG